MSTNFHGHSQDDAVVQCSRWSIFSLENIPSFVLFSDSQQLKYSAYVRSMRVPAHPPMLLYLLESHNFLKVFISKTVKLFVLFCKIFSCMFQLQMPSPLEEYFSIFRGYIAQLLHTDCIIPTIQQTAVSYSPKIWYYHQTEIFFLNTFFYKFFNTS